MVALGFLGWPNLGVGLSTKGSEQLLECCVPTPATLVALGAVGMTV
jgi:hypothetical protein